MPQPAIPAFGNMCMDPTGLEVIDKCMTVTGVIEESSADDDGDQHMLLKLDEGQDNLLKKKNIKKKTRDLVIEAICMNNITNPKVGGACKGYINHVQLPKVGDHVKVSGSYVIDAHNGWAEIHPITKIEVLKYNLMRYLLLFIPIAIISEFIFHNQLLLFVTAALSLVALSALLGEAIEVLSSFTSNKTGALLNATLGNAAELIFTIIALRAGQVALVKASIIGAVLGNLLVLPGLGMLLGGLKNGRQYFNREAAGVNSTMMTLSVAGLILPTIFELLHEAQNKQGYTLDITDKSLNEYSLGIAGVLIVVYLLSLLHSFTATPILQETPMGENKEPVAKEADEKKQWTLRKSLLIMAGSTLFLIYISDLLVGSIQHVTQNFHVSETFLGIILIPLLSDVAEHVVGIQMAYKNKMDLSMSISLESATQIALFVAPVLVFISFLMGKEMNLFFSPFELVILGLSVYIINQVSEDGESNWLEGAQLIVVYIIAAIGFYLL